jgi:hypothetical protein
LGAEWIVESHAVSLGSPQNLLMKINSKIAIYCALYCAYFVLYLFIYNSYVTQIYGYMGYENDLSLSSIPLAVIAIALCAGLAGSSSAPSVFFLHIALGTIIVPTMVLFCGANLPAFFFLISVSAYLVVALTSKLITVKDFRLFETSNTNLLRTFTALSIGSIAIVFLLGGGRFLNFDFAAVYEIRVDAAQNLPDIFAYTNFVLGKVIIPFGIVIAVLQRRWIYLLLLSSSAVLLFALTAHKGVLFNPLAVLLVYYITGKKASIQYFVMALIAVGIASAAEFQFSEGSDYWMGSLLVRRALLTPSLLNWFYIDWFSLNKFYFWADSRLSFGFVNAPDALPPANLIGLQYFGREETSANTGWIGSGYANAGLAGVLIYSLGVGLLLSILNSYAKRFGSRLVVSLFFILIITIYTSTDLITSLLTHGLLVALVLISIMRPSKV